MNHIPHPFGTEIQAHDILKKMAQCHCWEDKYRLIIQLGKKLPIMPENLRAQTLIIPGCESQVWLVCEQREGHLYFVADSNARIVKGLIAIILCVAQGKTPEDLKAFDFESYFKEMDLLQHISPSRSNGVRAIIDKIKSLSFF